jgi:hypothetical protein
MYNILIQQSQQRAWGKSARIEKKRASLQISRELIETSLIFPGSKKGKTDKESSDKQKK